MRKIVLLVLGVILTAGIASMSFFAEEPLIKIGDYNENVIRLHQKLSDLGYYNLRPESPWSERSENALWLLQFNQNKETIGVVQNKDEMIDILSADHMVGRNLLVNSDYCIEKNSKSGDIETKLFVIDQSIDLQTLIGKSVTVSIFENTLGERGTSSTDIDSTSAYRFGCCMNVRWTDSNGLIEMKSVFPATETFGQTVENDRISSTYILIPPEGYDTLREMSVELQSFARPAEANEAIWKFGYPKLEIGNLSSDWTNDYHSVEAE